MRAAIYARISGAARQQRGYSLESQVESCQKLTESEGWQVVEVFREKFPGTALNRPELDRLRDWIAEGRVDLVVVHDVDRLSRDPAHCAYLERELEEAGVKIRYVLTPDTDTPEGQLLKDVKSAVSRFENLQRVERSRRGARRKVKEQRVIVGPHRPYGYRVTAESTLEIDEEEAAVVRDIFTWIVSEGLTLCEIVRRLEGVPTKNDKTGVYRKKRQYGEWSRSSVRYILTNETYCGRWYFGKHRSIGRKGKRGSKAKNDYILCDLQPREAWLEVQVPAIISQEVFDAAQKVLAYNKRMARRNVKHEYLLGGLIYCECGRTMVGASYKKEKKVYKYYVCNGRTAYSTAGPLCPAYRVHAEEAEEAVWGYIHDLLMDPQNLVNGLEEDRNRQREAFQMLEHGVARIDRLLRECDHKLERLLDEVLASQFSAEAIGAKVRQLKEQREGLLVQRADFQSRLDDAFVTEATIENVRKFAEQVSAGLNVASFKDKRKVLQLLGVRVDCDRFPGEEGRRILISGHVPDFAALTTNHKRDYRKRSLP